MKKYLELFKDGFDSTISEKIKPENWPYVGYSPSEGIVFTMIPEKGGMKIYYKANLHQHFSMAGCTEFYDYWDFLSSDEPETLNKITLTSDSFNPDTNIGYWEFRYSNNDYTKKSTLLAAIDSNTGGLAEMLSDFKIHDYSTDTDIERDIEVLDYSSTDITTFLPTIADHSYTNSYIKKVILPNSLLEVLTGSLLPLSNPSGVIVEGGDCVNNIGEEALGQGILLGALTNNDSTYIGKILVYAKGDTVDIKSETTGFYAGCFSDDTIRTVILPTNISQISDYLFESSTVENINLDNIETIGRLAFRYSNIKEAILGDVCTNIGFDAFDYCENLEVFRLPKNLQSFGAKSTGGSSLLDGTKNIKKVICANEILPKSGPSARGYFTGSASSLQEVIFENVTIIIRGICNGCRALTKVILPNTAEIIQSTCFYNCEALPIITLPRSIKTIEKQAFYNCKALETIVYEGSIEEWNSVEKGENWNYSVPATYVQCSDGQVAL